jgi:rhodanese-related sulfurtransferase
MMNGAVAHEDVRRLQGLGAQVVEVLPREEYAWKHIAGAINLPLKELDETTAAERLDSRRPIVVYCHDLY